jgi:hypothetical protein
MPLLPLTNVQKRCFPEKVRIAFCTVFILVSVQSKNCKTEKINFNELEQFQDFNENFDYREKLLTADITNFTKELTA